MQIKILDPRLWDTPLGYAHKADAGFDLRAMLDEDLRLCPGQTKLIGAGFAIAIPVGAYGAILPRSGQGHKRGLVMSNLQGVIDSHFRGEVKIPLWNRGDEVQIIKPLERIAQMLILPVFQASFNYVEELSETGRGMGFGSSGK